MASSPGSGEQSFPFMPRSLYRRELAAGVGLMAAPLALFIGADSDAVRTSAARLVSGERSFGQQEEALSLLALTCIFVGGCAAVVGLLTALIASLASSTVLDYVSRIILAVIAPAGVLLILVRARSGIGRRRYDLERELPQQAFPGAEPRSWEVLPMVVSYGLALWLLTKA